mmetsp:Transcript_37142/g.64477  ORF Transcript_37142/g.64477 Transcript_37142/m.64477 type:complete len:131 (-) Transcript_37142:43-435(-)
MNFFPSRILQKWQMLSFRREQVVTEDRTRKKIRGAEEQHNKTFSFLLHPIAPPYITTRREDKKTTKKTFFFQRGAKQKIKLDDCSNTYMLQKSAGWGKKSALHQVVTYTTTPLIHRVCVFPPGRKGGGGF